MRFYDALQLDPGVLKSKINAAETPEERKKLKVARFVRAVLLVAFCVITIAPIGHIFGQENSSIAVALICIMLGLRFVDFGYCLEDALFNLGVVLFLLVAGPAVAAAVNPLLSVIIHFLSFFIILLMTTDRPEMGNGGIYSFAYVFIVGNPVTGDLLVKRSLLMICGYIICSVIYFFKHYDKHEKIRFKYILSKFKLSKEKNQWQLQFALGVSIFLTLGASLHLERMMWGGFACASLLGCYSSFSEGTVKERFSDRIIGVVIGSLLFAVLYSIVPAKLHFIFGPMGGFCLGFFTEYRHKTMINCFGALMISTGLYGLQGSVMLRIVNNLIGAAFGTLFFVLYQKLINRHFKKEA